MWLRTAHSEGCWRHSALHALVVKANNEDDDDDDDDDGDD